MYFIKISHSAFETLKLYLNIKYFQKREVHFLLWKEYQWKEFIASIGVFTLQLSRVTTKPTWWVCDQHGSRPACTSAQSDQDPCCSLSISLLVIGSVSEQHGSWSDCADAQACLDPCWSQTHYVGFVVTRLTYYYIR
jgi:hypothetical protein